MLLVTWGGMLGIWPATVPISTSLGFLMSWGIKIEPFFQWRIFVLGLFIGPHIAMIYNFREKRLGTNGFS